MNKIRVRFAGRKEGDSFRGIGVHTKELIQELQKSTEVEIVTTGADVVHYTKFNPFFLSLPLIKPRPKVVLTIHDLIPLIYPDRYPPGVKGKLIYNLQKLLINYVDKIITISETSKKDICRFLAVQPDKVKVIYLAAGKIFKPITNYQSLITVRQKYNLPNMFVLYVGDVNYNKNINNLAEACKLAGIPLVMVGKQAVDNSVDLNHAENSEFSKFLTKYEADPQIIRLGYVDDQSLLEIYNLAAIYCQPSYYEGFALPILEAFSCGTSVVASKIQTHVEIAGDAAIYADPYSPKDLADKLAGLMKNNAMLEDLALKGFSKSREFSWEKTAKETIDVYREVLGK
jgi:glycosyltransferase involved in cell wall biosynthesis